MVRIFVKPVEPSNTDTIHGRFVKLVTNEQVVEVVEFGTAVVTREARGAR